jgi:hypothetical protein
MRLEEEKLTGEEGETPVPCRQETAFGVTIERLGDSLAVDENGGPGRAKGSANFKKSICYCGAARDGGGADREAGMAIFQP